MRGFAFSACPLKIAGKKPQFGLEKGALEFVLGIMEVIGVSMSEERFNQRRGELHVAVKRLHELFSLPESAVIRDAAIHRFEFTFELMWKSLKLYLEHQGLETGGPRATLKVAFEHGLIPTREEGDVWLAMLEDRNQTTHTYSEELAIRIFARLKETYEPLLSTMEERLQALVWE